MKIFITLIVCISLQHSILQDSSLVDPKNLNSKLHLIIILFQY